LADLPGLIEGAHEGAGLGDRFLGHAERCGAILHLIDGTESGVVKAYKTIRGELEAYGHGLSEKPQILALNKIDSIPKAAITKKQASLEKVSGQKVVLLSGVSGEGAPEILRMLVKLIAKRRAKEKAQPARAKNWVP
jgi:GTP-binding protein